MDDPDHVEGVDFTSINPLLDDVSYPITTDELVDEYGDRELERTNAPPISVEELFGYIDDTFESDEAVRQMLLSQMPRGSEGRANYSDRGGSHPVETEAAEDAAEQTAADLEQGPATNDDRRNPEG
ncbi:hypothetical protein NDI56_05720 [Haloarcula sp. S1CR25-12]|uniref:DUF2795 domain-containing protein n=1 Tax=Haloarcula saliterrae TaxID=2950534 RepID=A0ABU2FAD8_9EURY|nr:hypothetical protein [Haloarcula sp. S1CR25-12]MDS0258888.1 hypothetical protein [Haloarcula sp. S1CR25-12]